MGLSATRRRNHLALYPTAIEGTKHNGIGTFVSIRYVRHKGRIDRIAAMRLARVIEVNHEELRFHWVSIKVIEQVIVSNLERSGTYSRKIYIAKLSQSVA